VESRNLEKYREQPIPLAPLSEQQRIVIEIEKQFTRLEAGIAALKRAQANLKRYKAAVLKAACEGKLVAQDASDESALELLARILAERRAKWEADLIGKGKDPKKAKYEEPKAPYLDELPELPNGWCWVSTEQLSYFVTDGDHNPPKRTPSGVPHLTAKNVFDWKLSEDDCTFISWDDFERTSKRYMPSGGDVIITCVGTLGRTAVVPDGYVFSADRNLAAIRLRRSHHRRFDIRWVDDRHNAIEMFNGTLQEGGELS
jgi:type I restriction enzyme S subunit